MTSDYKTVATVGSDNIDSGLEKVEKSKIVEMEEPSICRPAEYLYKIFDGALEDNVISNILTYSFALTIVLGFISSFIQTVPSFKTQPSTCDKPVCNDDPNICPGYMVCEPIASDKFGVVDAACIYIFTIEYAVRFLTVWACSSRVADIIPSSWPGTPEDPAPVYPMYEHYVRYIFSFKNLVDFATIIPYWSTFGTGANSKGATFLRVFRLLRVFKLLKRFKEAQLMFTLIVATLVKSLPALGVMLMFVFMTMIFFGSLIYQIEGGTFMATPDYPQGAYLRPPITQVGLEVSPYVSIPASIYWVVTTATTVGYGDLVPTSWIGRMLACIVMLAGLLVLALPVGVVGTNFADLYKEYLSTKAKEEKQEKEKEEAEAKAATMPGFDSNVETVPDASGKAESIDSAISGTRDIADPNVTFDSIYDTKTTKAAKKVTSAREGNAEERYYKGSSFGEQSNPVGSGSAFAGVGSEDYKDALDLTQVRRNARDEPAKFPSMENGLVIDTNIGGADGRETQRVKQLKQRVLAIRKELEEVLVELHSNILDSDDGHADAGLEIDPNHV